MLKKAQKVVAGILAFLFLVIYLGNCNVMADEWDEPVKFYNKYGNNAVFKPTSIFDGYIYFCSAGNISTSGTKYRTVGYKMTVKDNSGNVIQTIYYQMSGRYLKLKYQAKSSGKEYMLYTIALSTVRQRMNAKSLEALGAGKCTIV